MGGSIFIVGRAFSAEAQRTLRIRVGFNTARIIVYATEMQQDLNIAFMDTKGNILIMYKMEVGSDRVGMAYTYRAKASALTGEKAGSSKEPLDFLEDNIQDEPLLERLLQTQLRIASLTMFSYPAIARSMLLFICRITHKSRIAAVTHLEASTILSQLEANYGHGYDKNVYVVPSVTMTIYEGTISALLDAAKGYADQYARFVDKNENQDDRQAAAQLMVQQNMDAMKAQVQLLSQTQKTWEDSQSAMRTAQIYAEVRCPVSSTY